MCKSCRRKIKRRVTTVLLTPALIFSQPVLTQLDAIFESATAPGVETALSLVDALIPKAHAASSNDEAAPVKWTCPMHPHYIADEFGTCPICGMDLVKLETGNDPMNEASAENRTVVTVAPEVMQNMGVRLAKAEQSQFGRSIRSFGIVTENERRQLEITSRVEGWIEELKVTAVGDEVKKGDLLFKLYSPQLIVSQNNYLSPGTADLGAAASRSFDRSACRIKLWRKSRACNAPSIRCHSMPTGMEPSRSSICGKALTFSAA